MTYEEQIEWAKAEFKNLENKKQKIILELAKRLADAEMVEDTICEYISEQLQAEGYVTARYVRDCLPEKYKRKYKKNSEPTSDIDPNKDTEKILIGTDGKPIKDDKPQPTQPPASSPKVPPPEEPKENPLQIENDFLKEENANLKDAIHKIQQFTPAANLQQPQEDSVNTQTVRAGIDAIEKLVINEIPKLKNRGWKTVEITFKAI